MAAKETNTLRKHEITMGEAEKTLALMFDAGVALRIDGPPGCGKTAIATQFAKKRVAAGETFALLELNAATANLADVMGYLMPKEEVYDLRDGSKYSIKAGEYTYPYWFRDRFTGAPAFMFERGLLVIEEYGQAGGDVKRALATVINERRIGAHKLPAGFGVVLLSNREEDRSGVSKDFDFIINRLNIQRVRPDVESWLEWSMIPGVDEGRDVSTVVQAFAAHAPGSVFGSTPPEKQGPWCTPRSLVLAGRTIESATKAGVNHDNPMLVGNLMGQIGAGAATELTAFVKLRATLPNYQEIVDDPKGARLPEGADGQFVVCFSLASRVEPKHYEPIMDYVLRMKKAFGVTFVRALFKRDRQAIHNAKIRDWAQKNADIIAAIGGQ